jgi:hypothetical protein
MITVVRALDFISELELLTSLMKSPHKTPWKIRTSPYSGDGRLSDILVHDGEFEVDQEHSRFKSALSSLN